MIEILNPNITPANRLKYSYTSRSHFSYSRHLYLLANAPDTRK